MKKVMIATPSRDGNYCQGYVSGLMQVQGFCNNPDNDIQMGWAPLTGCSNIFAGRDQLAAFFKERTEYDILLWIDSDTGFTLDHFKAVLNYDALGYSAGCAVQPKKLPAAVYGDQCHKFQTARGFYLDGRNNICCESTGFGFFWVHRYALIDLQMPLEDQFPAPKIKVQVEGQVIESYGYHMAIQEKEVVYSEDLSFCKRLRSQDIDIVVMNVPGVSHEGNHVFEGMRYEDIKTRIFDEQKRKK